MGCWATEVWDSGDIRYIFDDDRLHLQVCTSRTGFEASQQPVMQLCIAAFVISLPALGGSDPEHVPC